MSNSVSHSVSHSVPNPLSHSASQTDSPLIIDEATPALWQAWLRHYHRHDEAALATALARPTPQNRAFARQGEAFIALLTAEAFNEQEWMLQTHWIEDSLKGTALEAQALSALVDFWTQRLRQPGRKISFRFRAEAVFEPLRGQLRELGYQHDQTRHEFRTSFANLPQPGIERLDWKPALGVCSSREALAEVMDLIRQGDQTFGDNDASLDILAYYYAKLSDAELKQQVHLGLKQGSPVALVLLEVVPRPQGPLLLIPWMGVHGELRGQGYGEEVHRHAFGMFRPFALDGRGDYYGGTLIENTAMLKLFERSGCKPYQTLEEWSL
jgi:GNAT superfamily N-acetyltransferase